jgi:uncharacterized protein (PEP-CTERM system associated)
MAITGRSELAYRALVQRRRPLRNCRVAFDVSAWAAAAAAIVAFAAPSVACAQRWTIEPSVNSQLTWTSNSALGAGNSQNDTVLDLRPTLTIRGEGARLRVSGSLGLNGITYVGGTQSSRVLPEGDISARLEAVERWLFLEAAVKASQTSSDPFGVRPDAASTSNTVTTAQARFSPSIEAAIGPLTRYRIRSDNTWSRATSADAAAPVASGADGYFGRHAVLIEHDPQPLGWRVEAERSETRYTDATTAALQTDLARAVVNYTFAEDFNIGLRGGYERNNVVTTGKTGAIYGAQAKWQPSARTLLSAEGERRFFGSAWRLGFDHRTPFVALSLGLSRGVQSTPQSLFELSATGNVEALLSAMLTTRIPDPAERARVVRQLIADQGLPSSTLGATSIFSQRLSLVTTKSGSIGLTGVRNSLVVSGFYSRTEDLPNSLSIASGDAANNSLQYGLGLTFSHRLAMSLSLSSTLDWSRIRALDPARTDVTTQRGARVQVNIQASPKTGAVIGGRYRKVDSTVATPGSEGSVYIGLDHKF